MNKTHRRKKAELLGRYAENMAEAILWLTGWRIVERRTRTAAGEIDLIAIRAKRLAFIEVKYRKSIHAALNAVSAKQKERMLKAGTLWLAGHCLYQAYDIQYDLMVLAPWQWPKRITNAFIADTVRTQDLI